MPKDTKALIAKLHEKGGLIGTKVVTLPSFEEAANYIIKVCAEKGPCELLLPEEGTKTGPLSASNLPTRVDRVIAAPSVPKELYSNLSKQAKEKGFILADGELHKYLASFDVGIAMVHMAIADTSSCMIKATDEQVRLATMGCEECILIVHARDIIADFVDAAPYVRAAQQEGGASYTTFITGSTRTADIERVLVIGIHGSLMQHIIILED